MQKFGIGKLMSFAEIIGSKIAKLLPEVLGAEWLEVSVEAMLRSLA